MFSRNKILFNLNELIERMNIYDINRNSFFDFDNHRKKTSSHICLFILLN